MKRKKLPKEKQDVWDDDDRMREWLWPRLAAYDEQMDELHHSAQGFGSAIDLRGRMKEQAAITRANDLDFKPLSEWLGTLLRNAPGVSVTVSIDLIKFIKQQIDAGGGVFAARKPQSNRAKIKNAVELADHIKELWRKEFGRVNRARGRKRPDDFAAEFYNASKRAVRKARKG